MIAIFNLDFFVHLSYGTKKEMVIYLHVACSYNSAQLYCVMWSISLSAVPCK